MHGFIRVVTLTASLSAAVAATASTALAAPAAMPQARSFNGTPAVGAIVHLGPGGAMGTHFCSASVVDSHQGDLVLTAAHCVSGTNPSTIAFVPGYRNGHAPHGIWDVTAVFVNSAWTSSKDPDDDFAFLVTAKSSSGKTVESVTGSEMLGIARPAVETVNVVGYPDGEPSPITCTNSTSEFSQTQMQFDCGGYTDGTSGGPFLMDVDSKNGLGTVIGVIGGYEEGGDTPSVSYAARFLHPMVVLFHAAASSPQAADG